MFSLPTLYFWWFGLYTFKMMDYDLNLKGWLEDATLFPSNEPSDFSLNFDLLDNRKTNDETVQVADFNDLPWYDEKVDLSIFEEAKNIQFSETDLNELLSIIGSNSDNSYLSSESQDANNIDALNFDLSFQSEVVPDSSAFPSSPGYDTSSISSPSEYLYSPNCEPISAANSPQICESDVTVDPQVPVDFNLSATEYLYSPECDSISAANSPESCESISVDPQVPDINLSTNGFASVHDSNMCGQSTMPAVFVTVLDGQLGSSDEITEALTIEEVSSSIRNKKYVSKVKEIPKVHVSLKNTYHPYSKATSKRVNSRAERKKIQNKEAAARYRVKKRIEEKELSDEISGLETEQKKLQSNHDDLLTEIKYLKKLMREMLERKGLI